MRGPVIRLPEALNVTSAKVLAVPASAPRPQRPELAEMVASYNNGDWISDKGLDTLRRWYGEDLPQSFTPEDAGVESHCLEDCKFNMRPYSDKEFIDRGFYYDKGLDSKIAREKPDGTSNFDDTYTCSVGTYVPAYSGGYGQTPRTTHLEEHCEDANGNVLPDAVITHGKYLDENILESRDTDWITFFSEYGKRYERSSRPGVKVLDTPVEMQVVSESPGVWYNPDAEGHNPYAIGDYPDALPKTQLEKDIWKIYTGFYNTKHGTQLTPEQYEEGLKTWEYYDYDLDISGYLRLYPDDADYYKMKSGDTPHLVQLSTSSPGDLPQGFKEYGFSTGGISASGMATVQINGTIPVKDLDKLAKAVDDQNNPKVTKYYPTIQAFQGWKCGQEGGGIGSPEEGCKPLTPYHLTSPDGKSTGGSYVDYSTRQQVDLGGNFLPPTIPGTIDKADKVVDAADGWGVLGNYGCAVTRENGRYDFTGDDRTDDITDGAKGVEGKRKRFDYANDIGLYANTAVTYIGFGGSREDLCDQSAFVIEPCDEPTKAVDDEKAKVTDNYDDEKDDIVTWTVDAKIQVANSQLDTQNSVTKFIVTDTLDKRLIFDNAEHPVKVESDGTVFVKDTDYTVSPTTDDGGKNDTKLTITFTETGLNKLSANNAFYGKMMTVEIPTRVRETGDGDIENEAFVNINDVEQKTDKAKTYWGQLNIEKQDADDTTTKLEGAEFAVYETEADANAGTNPLVTVTTNEHGQATVNGLKIIPEDPTHETPYKTFYVKETKAPVGYQLDSTVRNVRVWRGDSTRLNLWREFTDERKPGEAYWHKTDHTGDKETGIRARDLAGSEWKLTIGSTEIPITDCQDDTCDNSRDKDPRPGYFHVTDLEWGDYTLTEKKAPFGYVLDKNEHKFTINKDNVEVLVSDENNLSLDNENLPTKLNAIRFSGIVNKPANPPRLAASGGIGASGFYLWGLALCLGAGGVVFARSRLARAKN